MKLINEEMKPVDNEQSVGQRFWFFNIKDKEFYLNWVPNWDVYETDLFFLRANDKIVSIPSGFYILLAGPCGSLDWIQVDETIGKDLTCFVMDSSMDSESWRIYPFTPIGSENDQEVYFPGIEMPVVCGLGEDEVIMISKKDHYHKMKHMDVTDII